MESIFRSPFKTKQKIEELTKHHEIIKVADGDGKIVCEVRKWPNERPMHFRRRAIATAKALNHGVKEFLHERCGIEQ